MQKTLSTAVLIAALTPSYSLGASDDIAALKQQLDLLKKDYEQRIQALETRVQQAENAAQQTTTTVQTLTSQTRTPPTTQTNTANNFNPAISLILDGRYAHFDNNPEEYELPGFALGGEAGLGEAGFGLGHTELTASANIDNLFYGQTTLAVGEHDGTSELELEEAFIQTIGLGNGLGVKAGRFFSALGYLNEQHDHAWDFADAPLIYRGLLGNHLRNDGLQFSYIAPIDLFLQVGGELSNGNAFPAGGNTDGIGTWTLFAQIGGDIGVEQSWQLGLSHWQAHDIEGRTSGGHSHGGDAIETPAFSGDSRITALDLVYKWAPGGNLKNQHFKLQFEYFDRRESGEVVLLGSDPLEVTAYQGHQTGWYAQAIYQFQPQWRTGLRYDQLDSDNRADEAELLSEAGLDNEGLRPKRVSAMVEWLPSEFSRIRLQFNQDRSYEEADSQVLLQYTHSLGSHGAHAY